MRLAGEQPSHHHLDLLLAIERGEFPSWRVQVQIKPVAEAQHYRFNPFDLTKVWSHKDYPKIDIGTLTLNRNPDNYFAEIEQAAFNPANFVPGIGPTPEKMLQGRLFSYGDTQRHRLGINHTQLPVNCPHATRAASYGRDGSMRYDDGGRSPNYEPNSFGDAPKQSDEQVYAPLEVQGWTGSHAWTKHPEDTDFVQAGDLYRLMDDAAKGRLVSNIAGSLGQVTRPDIVERAIGHFRQADAGYGERVQSAVRAVLSSLP